MTTHHVQKIEPENNIAVKTAQNMRDMARLYTADAILTYVDIMHNSPREGARKSAADALLDRGWGKPTQQIIFDTPDDGEIIDLVSDAQSSTNRVMDLPLQIQDNREENEEPSGEQLTNGHLKE